MLAIDLHTTLIPRLHLQDPISKGLQLMNDFRVSHLPVVSENKYLGLISEDELMDVDDPKTTVEMLHNEFLKAAIHENQHFLQAVNISNEFKTNVVPVINEENEYLGVITGEDLLKALGDFSGAGMIGGIMVVEMERAQFTISEISKIVESNDATILHLNTTIQPVTGLLTVTIHINKKELASIVAGFERYDYNVIYYFGEEKFENEIESNYRHLMNYLDI